jgi:hypothetical protein
LRLEPTLIPDFALSQNLKSCFIPALTPAFHLTFVADWSLVFVIDWVLILVPHWLMVLIPYWALICGPSPAHTETSDLNSACCLNLVAHLPRAPDHPPRNRWKENSAPFGGGQILRARFRSHKGSETHSHLLRLQTLAPHWGHSPKDSSTPNTKTLKSPFA